MGSPDFAFDRWLRAIYAGIEAANASDLAAEAALARLTHELTMRPDPTPGAPVSAAGLPMEALLIAAPRGDPEAPVGGAEWTRIVELCQRVQSLAEIAAHCGVPLGVARALVAAMADAGLLEVNPPERLSGERGRQLVERVLSGLRSL